MKKIKFKLLSGYGVLLTSILALLGMASSCDPKVEYGTPNARFIVNGTVSAAADNQTIQNIRVVMNGDTAHSDALGKFTVSDRFAFPQDQTFSILFEDIDSTQNGNFNTLDTIVEFVNPEFTDGDGNWYSGEVEKEFNVKLKAKE